MTNQQPDDLHDEAHRAFYRAMHTPLWVAPEEPPADTKATNDEG